MLLAAGHVSWERCDAQTPSQPLLLPNMRPWHLQRSPSATSLYASCVTCPRSCSLSSAQRFFTYTTAARHRIDEQPVHHVIVPTRLFPLRPPRQAPCTLAIARCCKAPAPSCTRTKSVSRVKPASNTSSEGCIVSVPATTSSACASPFLSCAGWPQDQQWPSGHDLSYECRLTLPFMLEGTGTGAPCTL